MLVVTNLTTAAQMMIVTSFLSPHLNIPRWEFIVIVRYSLQKGKRVKVDIALQGNLILELRDVTCHIRSHSVTFRLTQVNTPRQTASMQAGTRFIYPGGMEGWVDLVDLIVSGLGVNPLTFRSQVWHHLIHSTCFISGGLWFQLAGYCVTFLLIKLAISSNSLPPKFDSFTYLFYPALLITWPF